MFWKSKPPGPPSQTATNETGSTGGAEPDRGVGATDPTHNAALAGALAALAQEIRADRREIGAERRRERRRGWLRYGFYLLIAVIIAYAVAQRFDGVSSNHIARVDVVGGIANNPDQIALLDEIAADVSAKALIVRINSPGGTVVGGEALYEALRRVAAKKPVVAVMGEVGASAAYMTALGADRIIARANTITASIGVIFTAPNVYEALDTVGVRVLELRSGDRKATPSPFQPFDPTKLDSEKELITEIFDWFVALVAERRDPPASTLALIRDGRIVTGRQALALGLVDEIGGEKEAVAWLEDEKGVAADLTVRERALKPKNRGLLWTLFDTATGAGELKGLVQDGLRGPMPVSQWP